MDIGEYIFYALIALAAMVIVGYLMLRYLDGHKNKWELHQESVRMECVSHNPIWGEISRGTVYVDVYRKKRRNGMYKYKNVKRH